MLSNHINLIQNPLSGEGCKIELFNMKDFDVLATALHAYPFNAKLQTLRCDLFVPEKGDLFIVLVETIKIIFNDLPLDWRVKIDPNMKENSLRFTVDVTSHRFDHLDRDKLFAHIASYFSRKDFKIYTDPCLDQRYYFPGDEDMKSLLNEWYAMLSAKLKVLPYELKLQINSLQSDKPDYKKHFIYFLTYIESHVESISDFLKDKEDQFAHELPALVELLLGYDLPFGYVDAKGQTCMTYPPRFSSMKDLQENENKRQALQLLCHKIKDSQRLGYLTDSPLYQKQICVLKELGSRIASADSTQTLAMIYASWSTQIVKYNEMEYGLNDFMQQQSTSASWLLWQVQSPALLPTIDQLENLSGIVSKQVNRECSLG